MLLLNFFFFQAEDGIRDRNVTGVQTCALPISPRRPRSGWLGPCGVEHTSLPFPAPATRRTWKPTWRRVRCGSAAKRWPCWNPSAPVPERRPADRVGRGGPPAWGAVRRAARVGHVLGGAGRPRGAREAGRPRGARVGRGGPPAWGT